MRFLFLKPALSWPRAAGHDVHSFHLAQALAGLGHEVEFALAAPPKDEAVAGLPLTALHSLTAEPDGDPGIALTWLQLRYLRYLGFDRRWLTATARLVAERQPDIVVSTTFDTLPCLAAAAGPVRVWYAADDYALRQLSMFQLTRRATWRRLIDAALDGLYERAFAGCIDRVWVVSEPERRAMRLVSGVRAVDVIANGVDAEFFRPGDETPAPHSCTFWGRLDAGPNIQAVAWFCRRVWPAVRREYPDARFTAYGFNPVPEVRTLAGGGVDVVADAPDIRPAVRQHGVAVMPFVSGGGIKNKLLEAAALGLPIVASPSACGGLDARGGLPITVARTPPQWVRALGELWTNEGRRQAAGAATRAWVTARHTWPAAAQVALAALAGRERPRLALAGPAAGIGGAG